MAKIPTPKVEPPYVPAQPLPMSAWPVREGLDVVQAEQDFAADVFERYHGLRCIPKRNPADRDG